MVSTLCCAVLLASAPSQDLNGKLNYEADGIATTRVLRDLSSKTGLRLSASAALDDEPLIIYVSNVKVGDLLHRIAETTQSTWIVDLDGARRLVPSPAKNYDTLRVQHNLATIRAHQQKIRAELETIPPFTSARAATLIQTLRDFLTSANAPPLGPEDERPAFAKNLYPEVMAKRIVAALSAEELARATYRKPVYWSTFLSASGMGAVPALRTAIDAFAQDAATWEQALAASSLPEGAQNRSPYPFPTILDGPTHVEPSARFRHHVGRTHGLVRASMALSHLIRLEIKVFDGMAGDTANVWYDIELSDASRPGPNAAVLAKVLARAKAKDRVVPLLRLTSGIRDDLLKASLPYAQRTNRPLPPHALRVEIASVTRRDPAGWVLPSYLAELHRQTGVDIVACPTDKLIIVAYHEVGRRPRLSDFLAETLGNDWLGALSFKDGWLLLANQPSPSRTHPYDVARQSRHALQELLLSSLKAEEATLDDIGRYAVSKGAGETADLSLPYRALALMGIPLAGKLVDRPHWAQFYGLLTADQQRDLANGAKIPISALDAGAREIIAGLLFGDLLPKPEFIAPDNVPLLPRQSAMFQPVVRFGSRVPRDGWIEARVDTGQHVITETITGSSMTVSTMRLSGVPAQLRRFESDAQRAAWLESTFFTPYEHRTIYLDVYLTAHDRIQLELSQRRALSRRGVPFKELPADLQRQILGPEKPPAKVGG